MQKDLPNLKRSGSHPANLTKRVFTKANSDSESLINSGNPKFARSSSRMGGLSNHRVTVNLESTGKSMSYSEDPQKDAKILWTQSVFETSSLEKSISDGDDRAKRPSSISNPLSVDERQKFQKSVSCMSSFTKVQVDEYEKAKTELNKNARRRLLVWAADRTDYPHQETKLMRPRGLEQVPVAMISCGRHHTMVLSTTGRLMTQGQGRDGQLGLGNGIVDAEGFKKVRTITSPVTFVTCGPSTTVAVTETGELYLFGYFLGKAVWEPTKIKFPENSKILMVAVGDEHFIASTKDKSDGEYNLYSWGQSEFGGLGQGSRCIIKDPMPIKEFVGVPLKAIGCGPQHTAAITSRGNFYVWGTWVGTDATTNNLREPLELSVPPSEHPTIISCADRYLSLGTRTHVYCYEFESIKKPRQYIQISGALPLQDEINDIFSVKGVYLINSGLHRTVFGFGKSIREMFPLHKREEKREEQEYQLQVIDFDDRTPFKLGDEYTSIVQMAANVHTVYFLKEVCALGVSVSDLMIFESSGAKAPSFFLDLLDRLEQCVDTDGLFRDSKEDNSLDEIVFSLNKGEAVIFSKLNPHKCARLLLRMYQSLPTPLINETLRQNLSNAFVSHQHNMTVNTLLAFHSALNAVSSGPETVLLLSLLNLLCKVSNSQQAQVSAAVLAITWASALIGAEPLSNMQSHKHHVSIVEHLILYGSSWAKKFPECLSFYLKREIQTLSPLELADAVDQLEMILNKQEIRYAFKPVIRQVTMLPLTRHQKKLIKGTNMNKAITWEAWRKSVKYCIPSTMTESNLDQIFGYLKILWKDQDVEAWGSGVRMFALVCAKAEEGKGSVGLAPLLQLFNALQLFLDNSNNPKGSGWVSPERAEKL